MISPERLAEIREYADRDILDLVEPEEMYFFLGLLEAVVDVVSEEHDSNAWWDAYEALDLMIDSDSFSYWRRVSLEGPKR